MRFVDMVRASALIGSVILLSACPKKDADVVPEPAAIATTAQPTGASDKAGAEAPAATQAATPAATPAAAPVATPAPAPAAPAARPKKKEDPGGW